MNAHSILARACRALLLLAAWAALPLPVAAQPAALPGFAICASQSSPVTGVVTLSADVPPEAGLLGVQFKLDGYPLEALDTAFPYEILWSAASAVNGEHTITAEARYASGEVIESAPFHLTVANPLAFNRTLYVDAASGDDANDGLGPSTAWRTLDRANQSVVAGDTVLLRGTFVGQVIRPLTSGTADRPITFRSAPGATAVLDGGWFAAVVWLDRGSAESYIIVDGLAMTNIGSPIGVSGVFLAEGAHHNVVRNSDLTGTDILIYDGSSDNVIDANIIRDVGDEAANIGDSVWIANGASRNLILNNRLTNGGHSLIQIGGDRPDDADVLDNVVANNVLSNRWATPLILSWRARRTLVEGNRISDGARNGVNPPGPGIQIAAGDNIIRYNEVFDNAGAGIHVGGFAFGPIGQDSIGNQIYHNVFYGNGGTAAPANAGQAGVAILLFEQDGRTVRDNLIANNVFFRNSGFAFGGAIYSVVIEHFQTPVAWPEGSLNGNRIQNNILLREPGSAGELAVLRIRRPDQGGNVDYTLAQFEALYPEAANNLETDPRFADEANRVFALQAGSSAIDEGVIIPGVHFQGAAPDIGIFEVAAAGGLVAAYGFDEGSGATAVDSSGNNRSATISGATRTTHTPGGLGRALAFDGVHDRVAAGTVTLGPAFTMMAWVFNPSNEAYETIMTVGSTRAFFLRNGVITFSGGRTFGTAISTNTWHHVALVYDGATLRAYLNGAPQGTARSVSLPAVTDALQIGAWIYGASNLDFFGGLIDEVRVYNRALTQAEVQEAMDTRVTS
ncbi:MAG: right-handed parallel beta-helix repeat-containing protein [Candidatus Rokubacteria bacterium]|nr:right-handed parallel beta-helix repeat-containing protein [Candidatus Rokubacteria bacterium]